ncbi:MAG: hypothetical protein PHW76_08315 [Alphaproteobacteria bacterium]|nr:hypothetical protein [Alphaproteobacteria bacterium]
MAQAKKFSIIKIAVDVFFAASVLLFFSIFPWAYFDKSPDPFISWMPIQLFLLFIDVVPAFFGLFWLGFRYQKQLKRFFEKHPFLYTAKFRLLAALLGVFMVVLLKLITR